MLPEEARLPHDLLQLRLQAAALEEHCHDPAEDFADLLLMVKSTCFRSVKAGKGRHPAAGKSCGISET